MKKVLIISYNFPPCNIIGARRYGGMTPWMPKFGWKPFVLTTKSSGDLSVNIPEKNIIRIGRDSIYSNGSALSEKNSTWLPTIFRPIYDFLFRKCNLKLRSIDSSFFTWRKEVLREAEEVGRGIKPDVIIASYPPSAALWIGRVMSKILKKPWVADLRDACSLKFTLKLKFLDKIIDKFLTKSATRIITVSPSLASIMGKFYERRVDVVYNGFKKEIMMGRKETKPDNKKRKVVYYAGSIRPHQIDSIKMLINWIVYYGQKNVEFIIRSLGPKRINEIISNYAEENKVSDLVSILDPIPEESVEKEMQRADILTVLEDIKGAEPTSRGTLTGKLLKYLPLGLPILAVARKDSDIGKILKKTNTGFLVFNFQQLKEKMKKILVEEITPTPNWHEIEKYSYENQCKALCNLLNQISF